MKYTKEKIVNTIKKYKAILESMDEQEQLNEFRHDGLHAAANSRRNPTDKPAVYYIAVDQYSDNFSGYDGYVRPDGGLTSANDFKHAAVTQVPESLKNMVAKAVARYGKKYYIFVYKDEYSYGNQTQKRHSRSSVIDIWYPDGQYWKYGMNPINSLNENAVESINEDATAAGKYLYVTKNNPSFNGMVRKIGATGIIKLEDPYQYETISQKLERYSTCVPIPWETAYQIRFGAVETANIKDLEQEFFALVEEAGSRYGKRELFSISDEVMKHVVDEFLASHPHAFLK